MWINEYYVTKYPGFSKFVMSEVPKVKDNPKIWSALLEAAGIPAPSKGKDGKLGDPLADLIARIAIGSGTLPQIVPKVLDIDVYGEFRSADSSRINICELWVEKFEKDSWLKEAQIWVLATVLHEIVHYLDFAKDGSFIDCHRDDVDRGFVFEERAFGQRIKNWQSPSD